jgi:hypothetical protein
VRRHGHRCVNVNGGSTRSSFESLLDVKVGSRRGRMRCHEERWKPRYRLDASHVVCPISNLTFRLESVRVMHSELSLIGLRTGISNPVTLPNHAIPRLGTSSFTKDFL